jgi:glycosyltransferase involved in cell wall biosynthesis
LNQDISVIIATFNGAGRIGNLLNSLCNQSIYPKEIIVVIDGSVDDTLAVVKSFDGKLPLKILEIKNSGRSIARNTGFRNSECELLVFFDDDMRPFRECLHDHLQHHQKYPGSLLVGAISEDLDLIKTDIQYYRKFLYGRKGWWVPEEKPFVPMTEKNIYLSAANFSINRQNFEKLNGFDENLRDTEDYDLGIRALKLNLDVYGMEKEARAYHDDRVTCKSYIQRQRQYRTSGNQLARMKPELHQNLFKEQSLNLPFYKRTIYSLVSNRYSVNLVDSGTLKYFLPQSLRFKFYDAVISGLSDVFPLRKI